MTPASNAIQHEQDDQHQRAANRVRTMRQAQIVWDNAKRTMNCIIRDVSKSGAKLAVENPYIVPNTFDLRIPPDKKLRPVQVMRREEKFLGIMFMDAMFSDMQDQTVEPGGMNGSALRTMVAYDPFSGKMPFHAEISGQLRDLMPWKRNLD